MDTGRNPQSIRTGSRSLIAMLDLEEERTTETISAMLASLHMVKAGAGRPDLLLGAAMDRLEAQLGAMRLTSNTPACEDIAEALPHLCRYVLIGREDHRRMSCALTDTSLVLDRRKARLVLRIAREMVEVALECSEYDDDVRVLLARRPGGILLQIEHPAPRSMPPRGARRRLRFARRLAAPEQGVIRVKDRGEKALLLLSMPLPSHSQTSAV